MLLLCGISGGSASVDASNIAVSALLDGLGGIPLILDVHCPHPDVARIRCQQLLDSTEAILLRQ